MSEAGSMQKDLINFPVRVTQDCGNALTLVDNSDMQIAEYVSPDDTTTEEDEARMRWIANALNCQAVDDGLYVKERSAETKEAAATQLVLCDHAKSEWCPLPSCCHKQPHENRGDDCEEQLCWQTNDRSCLTACIPVETTEVTGGDK